MRSGQQVKPRHKDSNDETGRPTKVRSRARRGYILSARQGLLRLRPRGKRARRSGWGRFMREALFMPHHDGGDRDRDGQANGSIDVRPR